MEARGIEPLSEGASIKASTGLSLVLNLAGFTPEGRIENRPALFVSLSLPKLTAKEEPGAMTPFSGNRASREGRAAV